MPYAMMQGEYEVEKREKQEGEVVVLVLWSSLNSYTAIEVEI